MWRERTLREKVDGAVLPAWVRGYLLGQGVVVTLLALVLLFMPEFMATIWPWNITRLLAQIYAAPFLAYGVSSLMLSRQQTWLEVRVVVIGTFVFAVGVLLASLIHRQLFSLANVATWLWFGGFLLAAVLLGLLSARSIRADGLL
jgi:undecaprenyl pyrophosphate phosphatase UppP